MARTPRRKPAQFTEPVKLWLTTEDLAWLDTVGEARKWSAPTVIRECIALVRKRRLL